MPLHRVDCTRAAKFGPFHLMSITRRTRAPRRAQTKHFLAHRATIVRMGGRGGNSLDAPVPSYVLDFTSLYGWAALREPPELGDGQDEVRGAFDVTLTLDKKATATCRSRRPSRSFKLAPA